MVIYVSKQNDKSNMKWYDNAKIITSLIICNIFLILICSQAFAVVGDSSLSIFSSVINHNTSYVLILIYFIILKTYMGKKYFNYLNVFLIFTYFMLSFTSFLTIIQSFSANTILMFLVNFILLIYLFHTMFRDTRVWKEFKLGKSPFNEIKNDSFFSTILIVVTISLIVNLISTVVVSGLVISILDATYIYLFSRYIYLYREYLDNKKIDANNKGNFDSIRKEISDDAIEIKEKIGDVSNSIKQKTNDFIDKNEINDKIDELKDKVTEVSKDIKSKTEDFIDKTEINEKVDNVKKHVSELSDDMKNKVNKKKSKSKNKSKGEK